MNRYPTAGIILAAGRSLRFGRVKQLVKIEGKPLISRVISASTNSMLKKVIVVLGYRYNEILDYILKEPLSTKLEICINHQYYKGQSSSLKIGLKILMDEFSSVMFLLADQPFVDSQFINELLFQYWHSKKDICVPIYNTKRGNPTIFGKRYYDDILNLKGDIGARDIIKKYEHDVLKIKISDPRYFIDIDTPNDLENTKIA